MCGVCAGINMNMFSIHNVIFDEDGIFAYDKAMNRIAQCPLSSGKSAVKNLLKSAENVVIAYPLTPADIKKFKGLTIPCVRLEEQTFTVRHDFSDFACVKDIYISDCNIEEGAVLPVPQRQLSIDKVNINGFFEAKSLELVRLGEMNVALNRRGGFLGGCDIEAPEIEVNDFDNMAWNFGFKSDKISFIAKDKSPLIVFGRYGAKFETKDIYIKNADICSDSRFVKTPNGVRNLYFSDTEIHQDLILSKGTFLDGSNVKLRNVTVYDVSQLSDAALEFLRQENLLKTVKHGEALISPVTQKIINANIKQNQE